MYYTATESYPQLSFEFSENLFYFVGVGLEMDHNLLLLFILFAWD